MKITASELKYRVEQSGHERHFFDRATMRFFGDTMRNYGARGPLKFKPHCGEECTVYELYRRRAVKHGLSSSAYFRADTYARTFGEVQS
jgi:hypothetical protein